MDYIYQNMAIYNYNYVNMDNIDPNNHIDDIIRWIVGTLQDALNYVCNLPNIDTTVRKYKQWHDAAYAFYRPTTKKFYGYDRSLLCAKFGYAVEEYVNLVIRRGGTPYSDEFSVNTQCRYGRTIPDIVIRKIYIDDNTGAQSETDVAWLDITSDGSVGHIMKKRGSGWRTKDIVIELVYPSMEVRQLLL